jgi:hypothetical protein
MAFDHGYSGDDMTEPLVPQTHPVTLVVTDDLKRNRLTVFFRILLVIPHLIWLWLWGIAAEVVLLVAWVAALIIGRVPHRMHNFLARFLRYSTRINAYILLLANPYPPFSTGKPYAVDARIGEAVPQGRLGIFFRIILAIPAFMITYVFRITNNVIALLGWFYALWFGRMHEGMRNTSAWLFRYEVQTTAYLLLLTSRYPSLAGAPTV